MKIHYVIIPMLAMTLMVGCKQKPEPTVAEPQVIDTAATVSEAPASEEIPETRLVPVRDVPRPARQQAASASGKRAAAKSNQPAETIYVETDDSRGRVWGHVTMKGDRGTGTVHDEGENTWAVTVTRHGNELYAVDQNSRQYVFKLKQNKTQE